MPWEYTALKNKPEPLRSCPRCLTYPFRAFMRGQVHSTWRRLFRRPYCSVICSSCKEIVGHERPV